MYSLQGNSSWDYPSRLLVQEQSRCYGTQTRPKSSRNVAKEITLPLRFAGRGRIGVCQVKRREESGTRMGEEMLYLEKLSLLKTLISKPQRRKFGLDLLPNEFACGILSQKSSLFFFFFLLLRQEEIVRIVLRQSSSRLNCMST